MYCKYIVLKDELMDNEFYNEQISYWYGLKNRPDKKLELFRILLWKVEKRQFKDQIIAHHLAIYRKEPKNEDL